MDYEEQLKHVFARQPSQAELTESGDDMVEGIHFVTDADEGDETD